MIDADQLRATERESGFLYPTSFWSIVYQLQALTEDPGFAKAFHEVRTASSQDVKDAHNLGLDYSVFPFMCDPQPAHVDYYCVGCDSPEILVFAIHTIVAGWPNFEAFIDSARQQCKLA